ncbi:hypothetical protein Nepgr_018663 [Nepenthes gracilis]|uniref:Uncharacterized protein n=1 Tax=Nepenthes gracilis TaxID=150966 RepID=A0AAD3STH8_NEPGR|nr:hypothetical protein Nepgr_018663 [Nepenthes gracilis]
MDSSTSQSKASLTNLAAKLSLKIPPHFSSSSSPTSEFNFSDVFGPPQSNFIPSPYPPSPIVCDPQIIRNLSHSFIGPSPRYPVPTSHPFHAPEETIPQISDDDEKKNMNKGKKLSEIIAIVAIR